MATLPKGSVRRQQPASARYGVASVVEAKAHLSSLLKKVEQNRTEITLLRRGVAVAKIVPLAESDPPSGYGWMQGSAREIGDIVGPTGEEWTIRDE